MDRPLLLDVYATFFKSGQIVERAVEGTGIRGEDFAFVSIVGSREPITPTEISREFGQSLSTVLFRAGRNVDLGLVERIANPHDRRSFLLRVTPKGRKAWAHAAGNLGRLVAEVEDRLDRPALEVHQALVDLQAAFDAVLAENREHLRR